jgi:urease accessory protein
MASLAYDAGSKHLQVFFEASALLIPFDETLFDRFESAGVAVKKEKRKLLHPLHSTATAPAHGSGQSLISKILHIKRPSSEG